MNSGIQTLFASLLLCVASVASAQDESSRWHPDERFNAVAREWKVAVIERQLASTDARQRYLGWMGLMAMRREDPTAASLLPQLTDEEVATEMTRTMPDDPIIWLWMLNAHAKFGAVASPAVIELRDSPQRHLLLDAPELVQGWLQVLPAPEDESQAGSVRELLAQAADADDWRDGSSDYLQAMLAGNSLVPLPAPLEAAELPWGESQSVPGRYLPQIEAVGWWAAYAQPSYRKLVAWCQRAEELDILDSCIAIADGLVEHGDTYIGQMIGLRVRRQLQDLEPTTPEWLLACRTSGWERYRFEKLARQGKAEFLDDLEQAWRQPKANEIRVVRQLLAKYAIDPVPPADFNPRCETNWRVTEFADHPQES